jgi:circadian clock protein KaiC
MMTYEVPDLFQLIRLSELGVSHVSDNVVVLQYLRQQSRVKRTLTVLKTRASLHEPQIREFTITPEGITLGGEITGQPDPPEGPRPEGA